MSEPLVSVLITSYNREKYIASSIESVLAQTFGDFELLITDNCSTDSSVEIANEYASRDARIRVVVNETNLGQFGNRNRAMTLARGQYIKPALAFVQSFSFQHKGFNSGMALSAPATCWAKTVAVGKRESAVTR